MAGFPVEFSRLLQNPQRGTGFSRFLAGRAEVAGTFAGRIVTLLVQRGDQDTTGYAVVAMQVDAPSRSIILAGAASGIAGADRNLEKAMYVLEAKSELRVDVEAGWLRAVWRPAGFFIFRGRFDRAKWRNVLESMAVVAAALESRPPAQPETDGPPAATSPSPAIEATAPPGDDLDDVWPDAAPHRPRFHVVRAILKVSATLILFASLSLLAGSLGLVAIGGRAGAFATTMAVFASILLAGSGAALGALAAPSGFLINESAAVPAADRTRFGGWLWLLLATLVALPAWMVPRLAPLVALAGDILGFLDDQGVWAMAGSDPLSGLVMLPAIGILSVPVLDLATASGFVLGALVLLPHLVTGHPQLPRAWLAFALLQAGLTASAQYATRAAIAAGRLLESQVAGEPEAAAVNDAITRYADVLQSSADALTWVTVGFAVWVPAFFIGRRVRTTYADRSTDRRDA